MRALGLHLFQIPDPLDSKQLHRILKPSVPQFAMWYLLRVLRGKLGDRVGKLIPWVACMCLDMSPVHSGKAVPTLKNVSKTAHQGAMVRKLFCAKVAARQVAGIQCIEMEVEMDVRSAVMRPQMVAEL